MRTACVVTLCLLCTTGEASTLQRSMIVVNRTDSANPVSGNKIKVLQGTTARSYLTDISGSTPAFQIDGGSPLQIWLKERAVQNGVCLGLARTYTPPAVNSALAVDVLGLFQPMAEALVLDSTSQAGTAPSLHGRWHVMPYPASSYLFPASVAILMTGGDIEGAFAYHGIQLPHDDYRLGCAIRVEDPEDVGTPGFSLALRTDSYEFTAAPVVDSYFIAGQAADAGTAGYVVEPELWLPSEGWVSYTVSGVLGKGWNLFLLREGAEFEALSSAVSSPPSFPPVAAFKAGSASGSQSCTPCEPEEEEYSCPVANPTDDPGCASSGCAGAAIEAVCDTTFTKLPGFAGCTDGGGGTLAVGGTATIGLEGGISAELYLFGSNITASVGASGSLSLNITATMGEGQGCGQCGQVFLRTTTCTKNCIVHKDYKCGRIFGMGGQCCHDFDRQTKCIDIAWELKTCNRPGQSANGTPCSGDPPCD